MNLDFRVILPSVNSSLLLATFLLLPVLLVWSVKKWKRAPSGDIPVVNHLRPREIQAALEHDPTQFLRECQQRYGDVFSTSLDGESSITHVVNPTLVEALLRSQKLDRIEMSRDSKSRRFGLQTLVRGREDVVSLQKLMRRELQPARLDGAVEHLQEYMARYLAEVYAPEAVWKVGPCSLISEAVVFGAEVDALFGTCYSTELLRNFQQLDANLRNRLMMSSGEQEAERSTQSTSGKHGDYQAALEAVVGKRSASGRANLPELYTRMSEYCTEVAGCGEREHDRFMVMMLWGAVINTVNAAFWLTHAVFSRPEVVAQLRREVHSVLGDDCGAFGEQPAAVTREQLRVCRFPLVRSCVQEVLRLHTHSHLLRRVLPSITPQGVDVVLPEEPATPHPPPPSSTAFFPASPRSPRRARVVDCAPLSPASPRRTPGSPRRARAETDSEPCPGRVIHLPPGTHVSLAANVIHRDPELFPNPDTFVYDRFVVRADDAPVGGVGTVLGPRSYVTTADGRRLRLPLFAFGGGHSPCPGAEFSMYTLQVLLIMLLQHMDVEVLDPQPGSTVSSAAVVKPAGDVRIRYRLRARAASPPSPPAEATD